MKLAVLFFHLLSVEVPGTVVEWILVAFFAVTLVTTACKPKTRQMLTLFRNDMYTSVASISLKSYVTLCAK